MFSFRCTRIVFLNTRIHIIAAQDPNATICTAPAYGIRPILSALPAWFRLMQCFRRYKDQRKAVPHLLNAGKYTASILVVVFSTLAARDRSMSMLSSFDGSILNHSVLSVIGCVVWRIFLHVGAIVVCQHGLQAKPG